MENADYLERFIAGVIDSIIVGLVTFIGYIPFMCVFFAFFSSFTMGYDYSSQSYDSPGGTIFSMLITMALILAVIVWSILVGLYYYVIVPEKRNGQTIGKSMQGLRIVRLDGQPLNRKTLAIRYISMWVISQIISIFMYITMFFDEDRRTIYDMVAGTKVVKV